MFFDNDLLIYNETGKKLYGKVKDLPIIDYHCHLDQKMIEADATFSGHNSVNKFKMSSI